jgi:hypothetical protein
VPLSADLILRVIRRSEVSTAPDLQAVLAHLGSEWIAPTAAVSVFVKMAIVLYQEDRNAFRRQRIVYSALESLGRTLGARRAGEAALVLLQGSTGSTDAASVALELDIQDCTQRKPVL